MYSIVIASLPRTSYRRGGAVKYTERSSPILHALGFDRTVGVDCNVSGHRPPGERYGRIRRQGTTPIPYGAKLHLRTDYPTAGIALMQ